jgi:copper ion binding protein
MNTITFNVPAMHCNHCTHTVSMELSDLEGVSKVDVDLTTKAVKVDFDAPATEQAMRDLLAEINYPVED